jgi:hypothetical protein
LAAVRHRAVRRDVSATARLTASRSARTTSNAPVSSRPAPATLYDHCLRAIENAGALGPHGLPLIGSGDWNDGMNRSARARREHLAGLFLCAGWTLCPDLRIDGESSAPRSCASA